MILRLLSTIKSRKINTVLPALVSTLLPYLSFFPGLYGCMITSWMFPYFSATAAMFRIVSNRSEELSPMPEKSRNAVVRTSDYLIYSSYISQSLPSTPLLITSVIVCSCLRSPKRMPVVKGILSSPACVSCASRRAGTLEGARRCTSVSCAGI
jgi:hypothetical protein